jgi:diguanylate cyclase (GGDEF)-like protein
MSDIDPPTPEEQLRLMELELARLSKLVYHDELTALFNRRGFLEEAERVFHLISYGDTSLERRTGFQIPFSIVFLDIDNFKSINDTYGHDAGDAALKALADTMRTSLRAGDLFGRLGGEEFVVALIGASAKRAALIGEKLRAALERIQFSWEETPIPLTASFGVAEYDNEATLLELISKADRAMYQAKEAGKNRVVVSQE